MLNKAADSIFGCTSDYSGADYVIFGAPFDSTTSYRPGARFGGRAVRSESYGLETYSPYLDRDIADMRIFDAGELELCIGSAGLALLEIEKTAETILLDGKFPIMLGGEHLVTLGAVRAAARKYPELRVIHLDAHADLRDEYLGAFLSHASVIRRVWDILGDGRIFQFGIRSGDASEFSWGREHVSTRRFDLDGISDLADTLGSAPVYVTIDLDVLDPSVFPGTGTPEPGGVSFSDLQSAVYSLASLNVIGFDLVELAPALDPSGVSTAVACKILREFCLAVSGSFAL